MPRQDVRLLEVMLLSAGARDDVIDVLEAEGLEYTVSDQTDDPDASGLIRFPIPSTRVEAIQERLTEMETDGELYTVVHDPEAVVSNRFGTANAIVDDGGALSPERISRRELHTNAAELLPDYVIYTVLTGVSAVVMTAGVLLEALSVLIGAMVIAPLLGPVLSTSAATVIEDRTLFSRAMSYQFRGAAMALLGSTAFAWLAKTHGGLAGRVDIASVLSISQHTAPAYLLATVAVGAGVAGAVSLSTNRSTELVGVMVAAAIMPAFATAGVALAWLEPVVALGSIVVAVMNVAILNAVAVLTFWYLGYKPMDLDERARARGVLIRRGAALVAASVVMGLFVSKLDPSTTVDSLLGSAVVDALAGFETRLQTLLT